MQERFDELVRAETELAEAQRDVRQLSAVLGPPARVLLHKGVVSARETRVQRAVDDIDSCLGFRDEVAG